MKHEWIHGLKGGTPDNQGGVEYHQCARCHTIARSYPDSSVDGGVRWEERAGGPMEWSMGLRSECTPGYPPTYAGSTAGSASSAVEWELRRQLGEAIEARDDLDRARHAEGVCRMDVEAENRRLRKELDYWRTLATGVRALGEDPSSAALDLERVAQKACVARAEAEMLLAAEREERRHMERSRDTCRREYIQEYECGLARSKRIEDLESELAAARKAVGVDG